jgi:hypothetical protein
VLKGHIVNNTQHEVLVNKCKILLSKLPTNNEYTFRDLGVKIVKDGNKLEILGLHFEPIDLWSSSRLETLYTKLVMTLQKVYEIEFLAKSN